MNIPSASEMHNTRDLEGKPQVCAVLALLAIASALERIADRMETEPVNDSTTHVRYERPDTEPVS